MKNRIILLLTALTLCACTANLYKEDARETLDQQGFTNIFPHDKGVSFVVCGGDLYYYNFTATNPIGKQVDITVCCDLMKACTIRQGGR